MSSGRKSSLQVFHHKRILLYGCIQKAGHHTQYHNQRHSTRERIILRKEKCPVVLNPLVMAHPVHHGP